MSRHGPEMRKLILSFLSVEAIPNQTPNPLAAALRILTDRAALSECMKRAEAKAAEAIAAIRAAPDNPFGDDEEAIAAGLNAAVAKKKAAP